MDERGTKRKGDDLCDLQCKRWKTECEENSDFIHYTSEPPSLESIAVVSIATRLCTQPNMKKDLEQISQQYSWETTYRDAKSSYQILHEKVLEKLSEMCLPNSLNIKVSNIIRPILLQLLRCFSAREEEYHQIYKFVKERGSVCWTMEGTIDRARSLKDLINTDAELICLRRLYYLACKYCIEECVSELWVKLSDIEKNILYKLHHRYKFHIMAYWTAVVKNELPGFLNKIKPYDFYNIYDTNASINQNMVSLAVHCGNPLALRYFWYKLTEQEIKSNVKKWFIAFNENSTLLCNSFLYLEYYERTDVLCFLLSNLNGPDEQKEMFQSYSMVVLKSLFFSWPFQKSFLPTITVMLDYLDEFGYVKIMSDIFNEIKVGRTTNELFREVWSLSPVKLRKKLLHIFPSFWCIHRPVWKFLSVGDIKTLFMMLNDASLEQKKRVIFDVAKDRKALFDILLSSRLELLDELVSKTLATDDIISFKQQVNSKHACFLFHCLTCKGAFQSAERFLNWVFPSQREIRNFKRTALNPVNLYYHLINWGDYENFNSFMKWYFGTEDKINKFKRAIINKINSSYERELLLSKLCGCGADAWDRFEKFFSWSTNNLVTRRQICQFKKLFLKGVKSIVLMRNFDFATKLLNWCTESAKMTSEFKNKFLLSDRMINLLVYEIYRKHPEWERMENLMMWFVPLSVDVVSELKSLLNESKPYKKNKLRAFYRFLDRFVEKYNTADPGSTFDQHSTNAVVFDFWEYDFIDEEDDPRDYNFM